MAFKHLITIDGVDVTEYVLSYKVSDVFDSASKLSMDITEDARSLIDFATQSTIVITRGTVTASDYIIFQGLIANLTKSGNTDLNIEGYDKLWLLERKSLTKTYDKNIDSQAGVISEIAKDIIETHGGLTASVISTGAVNVLDKFYCLNNSLLGLLRELAKLVDYMVYYDPQLDEVIFKPKGYTSTGVILETGVNIINTPKWDYDYTPIANVVTLTGDFQELETTESFNGDGSETTFTLTKTPQSVKVTVGTLQTGGVEGQNSSYDYTVDKENKTITFVAGSIPGVGVNNVVVNYSYLEPIVVTQKNQASRDAYGDYNYDKYIDTIKTTEDGEKKTQEIISKFGDPQVKTKLQAFSPFGLQAGDKITVIDHIANENREVVIRDINYNFPAVIDEIKVDNEPIYEDYVLHVAILDRINRLERKNQQRGNLIRQLFSLNRTPAHFRRKTINIYKTSIGGFIWGSPVLGVWGGSIPWGEGAFILAHPVAGVLGTSKLGTNNAGTPELVYSKTYTY